MSQHGWKHLLPSDGWCRGEGKYPITAYSEFMPPPRLGIKASGDFDHQLFAADDPWGWHVTEYEEAFELEPGLDLLARELLHVMRHLGRREPAHGIAAGKLAGNPYWPAQLHDHGAPEQECYVLLAPLALSRTQDDKGRVRWTLFGASEQGPSRGFWRGFWRSPTEEHPNAWGPRFFRRLLAAVYAEPADKLADLHKAGLRIMPTEKHETFPFWSDGPLPPWTKPLLWKAGDSLRGVRYLLTFNPFERLPAPVRRAYLAGNLHLLPFPGSLVFWGVESYNQLAGKLPLAMQIPLLHSIERHEDPRGIRVPQSGWMHEPNAAHPTFVGAQGPLRNTFQRTHRWARIHRHEDELAVEPSADHVAHVLFSASPDDIGLYGKPMARNAQIWTHDLEPLLDGPRATRRELLRAAARLSGGGKFGYRFLYPAMRVGLHELYWHRPLVAWLSPASQQPERLIDPPLGYLTAYRADRPQLSRPIELWPRLLERGPHEAAVLTFDHEHDQHYRRTSINVRKLLDTWHCLGNRPLERSFARQLLTLPRHVSLDDWLAALPHKTNPNVAGRQLADALSLRLDAPVNSDHARRPPESLTFAHTARRSFEVEYWRTIAELATGRYINKDNADCVLDPITQEQLKHHHRDLDALGDYILEYYDRTISEHKMTGRALAAELPFTWRTDFDFKWMGGWSMNQAGESHERDLVLVIPGRDRSRAVIMGDHYDTAYMEDHYGYGHGGGGPRLAAAGADDNHSATATLMLAAPILLEMSRQGRLGCDVWLIHLTGEEFPSDCMGARILCQQLIEGTVQLRLTNGRQRDFSKVRAQGVYVLDMVAHNNDRDPDVFQICPGTSRESMWLAYQAHVANRLWNQSAPHWNARPNRKKLARGKRSADGRTMPAAALHPILSGEVRTPYDPRSTLYNTDGQIFSDAGVPVVLFMENYDINRKGYHDSHDTLENIDLDYGSAVAAIAIESVARAATETLPWEADGK